MSSFLFDILSVGTGAELTIRLACLLNERGHKVYYTDSSDSAFTSYLLQKGIGRVFYPDDFRWFQPDLVLLDRRLDDRGGFYRERNIRIVCLELRFGGKQTAIGEYPLLFLVPTPLDYRERSDEWLVCAGPLLDTDYEKMKEVSKREELLAGRLSRYKQQNVRLSLFVVADVAEGMCPDLHFYEVVKDFCLQNPQYEVILCSDNKDCLNRLFPLPANMQFYLPGASRQLAMSGDLLVTNGDLDMLVSCIYHRLPVLLIPVTKVQVGNATRMVYHGLGLQATGRYSAAADFNNEIQSLLQHKEEITAKMDKMSELFDRKNEQVHYVLNRLEEWAKRKE